MSLKTSPKIALIGNPNSGKSSLFNQLTGLNQKIGNFPGVTVDKKVGYCKLNDVVRPEIIDLPGTYSLYPKSLDEKIVTDILLNPQDPDHPDLAVVVVDGSNIKRNLLLFTQVHDLGIPTVLVLNMVDLADRSGLKIDIEGLKTEFNTRYVVGVNARKGEGMDKLKTLMANPSQEETSPYFDAGAYDPEAIRAIQEHFGLQNDYRAFQVLQHYQKLSYLTEEDRQFIAELCGQHQIREAEWQSRETVARYQMIDEVVDKTVRSVADNQVSKLTDKLDNLLTHKVWGYAIFLLILLLMFQAIFAWATYPMDWIDHGVAALNGILRQNLPDGPLTGLLTEGIIAGIGGILIFIPQIGLLFLFISVLEETGYMSRVVFIMDKLMRRFGLNGKSVVPLISGVACAVPAIMATRNIDNWKERLITIFVTPLMSCSARIPVYTILIALVVPQQYLFGFINLQGLTLMGLYLLGFLAAILSAWVMKVILRTGEKTSFVMELPTFKAPAWRNVGLTVYEKVKTFVWEAGRVILAISIVLWVLASYGPGDQMEQAAEQVRTEQSSLSGNALHDKVAAAKLEHSYAGHFGKVIEPVIRPLGYDWKIGIALITSFAAREVFVGTIATIYSVGSDLADQRTIKERLAQVRDPRTGGAFFTPARAFSLLIFYVFAMQCMSTLAIVKRETKTWKWPIIQLVYMTGLAYVCSLVVYQGLV